MPCSLHNRCTLVRPMNASPDRFAMKIHLKSKCSKCGEDSTIGFLILEKSRHELVDEQDFSMAMSDRTYLASGDRLTPGEQALPTRNP
jgi:hypothetical protein